MKKLFVTALTSALALGSLLAPTAFATAGSGTASLHFSPASGSYTVGQTVTLTITETSATTVAAVEADVTYPSNLLQCNGPATLGAFATSYVNTCTGGSLSLAVGVQGTPVSGTQTVGTVSFKVLAAGNAALKVAGTSEIDDATVTNVCDSTCASGATAANYTLAAAPVQTTPPTGGSSTGNKSGSNGSTTTGGSTTTTTGSTTTTTSGSTNKNSNSGSHQQTNNHYTPAPQPKYFHGHHTGLVTSTITGLLVVLVGLYWLVIRGRTEVKPAPAAYKLNAATVATKTSAKKTASRTKTAAKRSTTASKTSAKKTVAKKKA